MIPVKTILFAASEDARQIEKLLQGINPEQYPVIKICADLADAEEFDFAVRSSARLMIIHQGVKGFSTRAVQELVNLPGPVARVVLALVSPQGDVYDAVLQSDAMAYRLPLRKTILVELHNSFDQLYLEASKRRSSLADLPSEKVPEIQLEESSPVQAVRRLRTQVISAWSSKGGDGKTLAVMELAYLLANVAGRRTLLVDADMNRGYLAPALGREAMQVARGKNLVQLASIFQKTGRIGDLDQYVHNYPPARAKGVPGNLDILFGLQKPGDAALPAFYERQGQQGADFIRAVIQKAEIDYEFVIFDIGTLIHVHVHRAILRECSSLLVVSAPTLPAIGPTTDGLDSMIAAELIGENKQKAGLLLNKYTDPKNLKISDFQELIGIKLLGVIPAVSTKVLHDITNDGRFYMETFLGGSEQEALRPVFQELIKICEYYSPGTIENAEMIFGLGRKRRGIFRRRK